MPYELIAGPQCVGFGAAVPDSPGAQANGRISEDGYRPAHVLGSHRAKVLTTWTLKAHPKPARNAGAALPCDRSRQACLTGGQIAEPCLGLDQLANLGFGGRPTDAEVRSDAPFAVAGNRRLQYRAADPRRYGRGRAALQVTALVGLE